MIRGTHIGSRFPWIYDSDSELIEIFNVAGYKGKIMVECGGSQESVKNVERLSLQLARSHQGRPPVHNRFMDCKEPTCKPQMQIIVKPLL